MGLDILLADGDRILHQQPDAPKSARHPGHVCTPTYLRSSNNELGFDYVVRPILGTGWGDVFWDDTIRPEDGRITKQQLRGALDRAAALLADVRELEGPDMARHVQAAEITVEFIELALTLEDPRILWAP